jgi:hypothetical protein
VTAFVLHLGRALQLNWSQSAVLGVEFLLEFGTENVNELFDIDQKYNSVLCNSSFFAQLSIRHCFLRLSTPRSTKNQSMSGQQARRKHAGQKSEYCESTDYPDGPLGLSGWLFFIRISGSHIISGWSGI